MTWNVGAYSAQHCDTNDDPQNHHVKDKSYGVQWQLSARAIIECSNGKGDKTGQAIVWPVLLIRSFSILNFDSLLRDQQHSIL